MKDSNELILMIISIVSLMLIYNKINIKTVLLLIILSIIGFSTTKRIGLSIGFAIIITYIITMLNSYKKL